jgi:hypothetical protein
MKNTKLINAKKMKIDEFYTQLQDIESELKNYKSQFENMTILLNADDPFESNFFKYFASNFNHLKLKKLIATSFSGSPIAYSQLSIFDDEKDTDKNAKVRKAYKIVINEVSDVNNDGAIDLADVEYLIKNKKNVLSLLSGNGDFRSQEVIELLKQADIVVTNPPFSLFREFISQLVEYEKKFLVIGNKNSIIYKSIFQLIKKNKFFTGYRAMTGGMWFHVPNGNDYDKNVDGLFLKNVPSCWFTNLEVAKHNDLLTLYKKYNKNDYMKFENFNAINVDKVSDIPNDYNGLMGVPITFLDKYNPKQFEIVGLGSAKLGLEIGVKPYKPEHRKYRKEVQKRGTVDGDLYLLIEGIVTVPYSRVIIKKRG